MPGGALYSTTLTSGWAVNARYRSSSCARLVAVMVMVKPMYLPPLLGRRSMRAVSNKGSQRWAISMMAGSRAAQCRTLPMWTELDRLISGYLDGVTVADLMKAREGGDYVI